MGNSGDPRDPAPKYVGLFIYNKPEANKFIHHNYNTVS